MRNINTRLSATFAISLVAVSAVGVAAQEGSTAPVEFTAKWAFGNDLRTETSETVDGLVMTRGGAWRPVVILGASDPRLEGRLSIAANSNEYPNGAVVWNYAFRIENEDGAWQQLPTIDIDGLDDDLNTSIGVMVGEGGYAGLSAVFNNVTEYGTWTLHGYIIDGELTPEPEPYITD
jgi:hypothetical protein